MGIAPKPRKSKSIKRVSKQRFRDVGLTAARNLLVRALRRAGLQHAISGRPTVIGFVLSNPTDTDIFIRSIGYLFELLSGNRLASQTDFLKWSDESPGQRKRNDDEIVANSLAAHEFVFGFASRPDDFPALFRIAADGIVQLPPLDVQALRAAMRNAGLGFIPDHALEGALNIPLQVLSLLTKRPRSCDAIKKSFADAAAQYRVDRAKASIDGGAAHVEPTLDDLSGFGDAAVWGRELAVDLRAFQSGHLSWKDVDRGMLLSGPTGTGKTTFARALARTCEVPIHVHSLARWQAKGYLNDLLRAMRSAFNNARADAPCILFIDELDSFGDRDQLSGRNENYEREVINALLECLDGADEREGVIVVGATNMPDKIDRAILRPGRLGKHIRIPLPDAEARSGILQYFLGNDLAQGRITEFSRRLEGSSGAEIEQIARDAKRHARTRGSALSSDDIEQFLPPLLIQNDASFAVTCAHEAGHVVVGHVLGAEAGESFIEGFAVRELHRDGTSGWTVFRREPALHRTKSSYLAELTILLAGIAAETVRFGANTDSAGGNEESDLHRATLIAARMELSLGLGNSLVYSPSSNAGDVFQRLAGDSRLRQRVSAVLDACMQRATDILIAKASLVDGIADIFLRRGTVTASDLPPLLSIDDRLPPEAPVWSGKHVSDV